MILQFLYIKASYCDQLNFDFEYSNFIFYCSNYFLPMDATGRVCFGSASLVMVSRLLALSFKKTMENLLDGGFEEYHVM